MYLSYILVISSHWSLSFENNPFFYFYFFFPVKILYAFLVNSHVYYVFYLSQAN